MPVEPARLDKPIVKPEKPDEPEEPDKFVEPVDPAAGMVMGAGVWMVMRSLLFCHKRPKPAV